MLDLIHTLAAESGSSGSTGIATYGPILAGVASLAAVMVSLLGRKDKQKADATAASDASTNTAIKGLTEAYDRINVERKEESDRADRAEARATAAEQRGRELELQLAHVQGKLSEAEARLAGLADRTIGPRKTAARKTGAKKTAAKKTTTRRQR